MTGRRRWPTDSEKRAMRRLADDTRAQKAAHQAKYGEHVCVPDRNDPWSVCDRETAQVES